MAGRDHEEKRQFQRMQLSSQLQFRRNGSSRLFKGETLDLSATGVRFKTSESLDAGSLIQIVINSQHPQIAPLVAEGEVIRSDAFGVSEDQFEVSVLFSTVT